MARMALGLLAVLLLGLTAGCGDQGADESAAADPAATAGSTGTPSDPATPGPNTAQPAESTPPQSTPPASTVPPADTAAPTTVPPLSSVPPPTMAQPVRPPADPSDQFKPVTVTGQVAVSGDCVDLLTTTTRWTLVGPAAATLQHGIQVEITGLPSPQLQTPCGDAPLQVFEVRPR
jgi:hypothetical protein